jgi:hypothetical protein
MIRIKAASSDACSASSDAGAGSGASRRPCRATPGDGRAPREIQLDQLRQLRQLRQR